MKIWDSYFGPDRIKLGRASDPNHPTGPALQNRQPNGSGDVEDVWGRRELPGRRQGKAEPFCGNGAKEEEARFRSLLRPGRNVHRHGRLLGRE